MSHFTSHSAYRDFAEAAIKRRRYIPDGTIGPFLQGIRRTIGAREEVLDKGGFIYRAQIGSDWRHEEIPEEDVYIDEPTPLSPKRMLPDPEHVGNGRANPDGIAYFYGASDLDTAIAEVRPWVGAEVSVGIFQIVRDLSLVDCTIGHDSHAFYYKTPDVKKWDEIVWKDIDRAFARPISPNDTSKSYIPTQILAELFLEIGFDGVAYKSTLGTGHNIAIFKLDSVELRQCGLFQIRSVKYDHSQMTNPYTVKRPVNDSKSIEKGSVDNGKTDPTE